MISRRDFALSLAAGAAAPVALASPAAADPIVMKIGTSTIKDAQNVWMDMFKASLEKATNGQIQVQNYPASQLGSIPREIENTQFGAIQGFVGPPEFLSGVDERFEILSAPGIFHSMEQGNRILLDPVFRKVFLGLGEAKGLKGISLTMTVPASFISRKPVRTLDDIKGMKVRVLAGPFTQGMMRALGATAVPMPTDQILPALQQGAIDAVLAGTTVGSDFKFFSIAKYATEINQPYLTTIVVISKLWYDQLTPALQKTVDDVALKTNRDVFPTAVRIYNDSRKEWTEGGGELLRLSAPDQKQMMSLLADMSSGIYKDRPNVQQTYDLFTATARRYS